MGIGVEFVESFCFGPVCSFEIAACFLFGEEERLIQMDIGVGLPVEDRPADGVGRTGLTALDAHPPGWQQFGGFIES